MSLLLSTIILKIILLKLIDYIDDSSSGDVVTVTGVKTGDAVIALNIPVGCTVVWEAVSEGLSFSIGGGGTFEVAAGGKIEVIGKDALVVFVGDVVVSGGKVLATGMYCTAIDVGTGNVLVFDGEVIADGAGLHGCYAVYLSGVGTVTVLGGTVSAVNALGNMFAITLGGIPNGGLAAYLVGTCVGDFQMYGSGIIVEVESLDIPDLYGGTSNGLTRKSGNSIANVQWDTSGVIPVLSFNNGQYSVVWQIPEVAPPGPSMGSSVRLAETGGLFDTLTDAIDAADIAGLGAFTLEVIGDVIEAASPVVVTSDVTIVGAEGVHTVSDCYIQVRGGGSLTLGDGTIVDLLTILGTVHVYDGYIDVKDGIRLSNSGFVTQRQITSSSSSTSDAALPLSDNELSQRARIDDDDSLLRTLRSGSTTLLLSGPNAYGVISGGRIEGGDLALSMEHGAHLSEISGGVFTGNIDAVHLTDDDTVIDLISSGVFYQTDADTLLHGHAIFVQNNATITEISGGYFDAVRNSALVLIRGGKVGTISGGEFVVHRTGTILNNDRNAAVWIENGWQSEGGKGTGINAITGGRFIGTNFGVLAIDEDNVYSYIHSITGGEFSGTVALQNDRGSVINEISGGTFTGSQGIFNVGEITKIGGADLVVTGNTGPGIYNWPGGVIKEINGGLIRNIASGNGIGNYGEIHLISGGTIIGAYSAINCISSLYGNGKLGTISNGVFWGKTSYAIILAFDLTLEPGLTADKGHGRYQSGNGAIFNNEALVKYPYGYQMSTISQVETVPGVGDDFRYLILGATSGGTEPEYFHVIYAGNVFTSGSVPVDSNEYADGDIVTVLGQGSIAKTGYTFLGWSTSSSATLATYVAGSTFTITDDTMLYAVWSQNAYTVTFAPGAHGTFTAQITTGLHYGDATPAAPTVTGETGWRFAGWTPTPTPTVTDSITYTAQWTQQTTTTSPPSVTYPSTSSPPTSSSPIIPTPTTSTQFPPSVIGEGRWALVNLILSILGIIFAAIVTIRAVLLEKVEDEKAVEDQSKQNLTQSQQQYTDEQNSQEDYEKYTQRRTLWLLATIVLGIVGIVVFLLTENWHLPMALVDRWTIVNALILIVELVAIAFVFKHKKINESIAKRIIRWFSPLCIDGYEMFKVWKRTLRKSGI
jgi:uncharacterized repeat protein (TIGR02543 family)